MTDKRISELPGASTLADADLFPIVQSGDTKKLTGAILKSFAQNGAVLSTSLGSNSGVATLDASGKLTAAQIPDISIVTYLGSAANQTAMLALTGQQGDWCTRSDTGTNFVITGSNSSLIGSWTELSYPTAPVTSVSSRTGAVTLTKSDVGLSNVDNTSDASKPISTATQTALNLKAASATTLAGYGITDAQSKIASTGLLKGAGAGSVSGATAGSDYLAPPSGTAIQKANAGGALANAVAGTDYQAPIGTISGLAKGNGANTLTAATAGSDYLAPPTGTAILKANTGGALANAVAGTDYQAPIGTISGLAKGNGANALTAATAGTDYLAPSVLGAASGVATLGSDGKLTTAQIPDISVVDYLGSVASQTAMLALTGQKGDWCTRSDLGTNFVITGSTPSLIGSWTQLSYPTAPVTSVASKTGAVTLTASDVGAQASITVNGIVKGNGSGVLSAAAAGTDYQAPIGTISGLVKGNGANALTAATAGTDFLAPPSGTAILKANAGGALANAVAGTDYQAPIGTISGLAKGNGANALTSATAGTDYLAPSGALGTPASGTLTNCTGLPISSGVSGLATGAATFLATPTSANLAALLTDKTGSGANVHATSPTLVTPTLGVASATSINKVALTAPATGSTLTIADGKTLTASNSITLAGTDSTTMTFPPASASVGYLNIPQNAQTSAYTLVLADSGKHIYMAAAQAATTMTIPANGTVAFPIGTAVTFVNMSANAMTIAITTDTMYLGGTGTTGSRTLAQYGTATALKMTSTTWIISGSGLT